MNPTLENECKLKRFKVYVVYSRIRLFWIYTTINFFKTFFSLLMCVLKIFSILKKKCIVLMFHTYQVITNMILLGWPQDVDFKSTELRKL